MGSVRKPALAVIAATTAALALAGCSGGGGGSSASSSANYVNGKTFTFSISADPGALDPQASAVTALFALTHFAYDSLVSIDAKGEIGSQLAKAWKVDGTTATLTMNKGITCSDGSEFTAQTAAENIAWIADPANKSPFLGAFLPAGVKAVASGDTLTLTLASPAPFVLQGLANLPMVCEGGLKDRSKLTSATDGTGPFVLKEAVSGDHYTYSLNTKYAWGPDGVTAKETGLPSTVVAKVVGNETTAANMLLSGELNATQILGADAARLDAAKLASQKTEAIMGQQWYNHASGHPTSDPVVRKALTQALDLANLRKVITSGTGEDATALAVVAPTGCTYDSVKGSVPGTDVAAAKAALDADGWKAGADGVRVKNGKKLSLTFVLDTALGTGGTAAGELAVSAWKAIGVDVQTKPQDASTVSSTLFGTGSWDIAWEPLNVNTPDQVVGFVSGPAAPKGTNFSGITNADYDAAVTKAMAMNGTASCDTWKAGETALFSAADVVPFANSVVKLYSKGATLTSVGGIVPTSIRMLG